MNNCIYLIQVIDAMNIKKVDLNLLHTLLVLLEECNVSRSAQRLNLTQPTVSNSLARLRSLLDDPLFTRTRHGLVPTSRALALEPELRHIFSSVESILTPDIFDPMSCDASIALSANDYMQYVVLTPAVLAMRSKAPTMKFAIRQAEISELVSMLDKGVIDIAVTIPAFSDPRLRSRLLYQERYVVAMQKSHPLASKRLSMKQFLSADHAIVSPTSGQFFGPTDDALKKLGLKRNVVLSVSSFFTLVQLLTSSEVIALIPLRLAQKFSAQLHFTEAPLEVPGFDVITAWGNKTHRDPVRQWVIDQIQQLVADQA